MLKKYRAKSNVSISVVLPSKKSLHVTFLPMTGGSSVYYTEDEDEQKALESHYKFGKLFKLEELPEETATENTTKMKGKTAKTKTETPTDGDTDGDTNDNTDDSEDDPDKSETELTTISVSCLDDAKDYLSDKFGISRTKLRSKKSIIEAAEQNGIVFEGI